MDQKIIEEETEYLNNVNIQLSSAINSQINSINKSVSQINELQNYFVESRNEIDDAEAANIETELNTARLTLKHSQSKLDRLDKIKTRPYFGKINFKPSNQDKVDTFYIGIHDFEYDKQHLIFDWRAPVSSIFYEFSLGEASYNSPSGLRIGTLLLKRQFKIESNTLRYCFDTSMNINDEILQQELSKNSSNKMKNIVNTIQAEQNKVIRNEDDDILIIQGHAGSGKTSIALHRIAYLLYHNKSNLKSDEILIISPNKIFSDYISQVLPELGEDSLTQMDLKELVKYYITEDIKLSSSDNDIPLDEPLQSYLSSVQIIKDIENYSHYLKLNQFAPTQISCKTITLSANEIDIYSRRIGGNTLKERQERLTDYIIDEFEFRTDSRLNRSEKKYIKESVKDMYHDFNNLKDFKKFFEYIKRPEFSPPNIKSLPLPYVFPYLYLKLNLGLIKFNESLHHIVVDEMQDYSPIQYRFLKKFFNASMTVIGDIFQSINTVGSKNINDLEFALPGSNLITLNKSYRSTLQIMNLAKHVLNVDNIEIIERQGTKPEIHNIKDFNCLIDELKKNITDSLANGSETIGIIVKSEKAASDIYENLRSSFDNVFLLNKFSTTFNKGISIITTSMAKGLEFDHVILPDVNSENYKSQLDRHHLYVGITRAKHNLDLYYSNTLSSFLDDAPAQYL